MAESFMPAPKPPTELGRLRILSPSAGIRVSPLVLGAASIGQAWTSTFGSMDKKAAFELLDNFHESGGNFIDTANTYQDEESEAWIGEWMKARGNRDEMVIATKFTSDYKSYKVSVARQCQTHLLSMLAWQRTTSRKPFWQLETLVAHEFARLACQITDELDRCVLCPLVGLDNIDTRTNGRFA